MKTVILAIALTLFTGLSVWACDPQGNSVAVTNASGLKDVEDASSYGHPSNGESSVGSAISQNTNTETSADSQVATR